MKRAALWALLAVFSAVEALARVARGMVEAELKKETP